MATTVGIAIAADGPTTQPTPDAQQMAAQIRQLQDKVDQLEAKDAARQSAPLAPVSGASASPQGSTLYHQRGDLDPIGSFKPASGAIPMTSSGDSAGYIQAGWNGNQFTLRSADGNFTLHPGVTVDLRDMTSYREQVPAKGGGSEVTKSGYDTQNGFDVSRLRLIFDGTLFHQVSYLVQFSADQGASLTLYDACATYRFGDGPFSVKVGQFKDPVWHERNLSEANLLAVDRPLIEQFLAGGQGSRIQGGAITYDQDRLRAQLVAHDGFDSQNTKFFDAGGVAGGVGGAAGVTPTNYGFSGRAEYMLIGNRTSDFNPYSEYDQYTSLHDTQDILVVGAGADYSQAGANDVILQGADVQYNQVAGFSAAAGYYGTYRKIHTNQGVSPAGYYYDGGFAAQVAYLFNQTVEPFARYDWIHFDPSSTRQVKGLSSHVLQEITVGANYYVYGQKLKVTVDANFLPNGSPADADAAGVLKDSGNNEFVLRAQLQLAI
jgi:hypothetical protein